MSTLHIHGMVGVYMYLSEGPLKFKHLALRNYICTWPHWIQRKSKELIDERGVVLGTVTLIKYCDNYSLAQTSTMRAIREISQALFEYFHVYFSCENDT